MSVGLLFGLIGFAAVAVPVLVFVVIMKRSREVRLLTVHGVTQQGRVVRRLYRNYSKQQGFYGIIYEFADSTGRMRQKNVHLNMADESKYVEGGPVMISVMLDYPDVNALQELVDRAKAG